MDSTINGPLTILAIDDEPDALELISRFVEREEGLVIQTFASPADGIAWASSHPYDVAFVDYQMPDMNGIEVCEQLKEDNPQGFFVIMTAYADLQKAIASLRAGLFDFISKPFTRQELWLILDRIGEAVRLRHENQTMKAMLKETSGGAQLLGASPAMAAIRRQIAQIATSSAPTLITGETGVGKEVVARAIHQASDRNKRSMVAINCSAFVESLLESELFGHEKGAFTGAERKRIGKLEQAADGSVLLDELCEIPAVTQVKLLRVLQEKVFERVGGNDLIPLAARIISATNRDIEEEIASRRLREDLFHRVNTLTIHIPPLRERREDIEPLALRFLEKFALINEKPAKGFAPGAMEALLAYDWPGNVRELENSVESAVIYSSGEEIIPDDLSANLTSGAGSRWRASGKRSHGPMEALDAHDNNIPETVASLEKEKIEEYLIRYKGNKTRTASALGLTLSQLIYRIKKYEIAVRKRA